MTNIVEYSIIILQDEEKGGEINTMNKLDRILSIYRNAYAGASIIVQASQDFVNLDMKQEELDEMLLDEDNKKVQELSLLYDSIHSFTNNIKEITKVL